MSGLLSSCFVNGKPKKAFKTEREAWVLGNKIHQKPYQCKECAQWHLSRSTRPPKPKTKKQRRAAARRR